MRRSFRALLACITALALIAGQAAITVSAAQTTEFSAAVGAAVSGETSGDYEYEVLADGTVSITKSQKTQLSQG